MPHIEQPLQLTIFFYKSQQIQKVNFFKFVFKVMEYPQTHTQKFNLNQEKYICFFSATPSPSGGGGVVAILSPNFWYDPPG